MEHADNIAEKAGSGVPALDVPELYQCVHCGLCLDACPTYRVLRIESESPRGRIHLVRAAAEGRIERNEGFADHLNLCLMCRACESACPSGVKYGRIAEAARAAVGPPGSKLARAIANLAFTQLLPFPLRLRLAARPPLVFHARCSPRCRIGFSLPQPKSFPPSERAARASACSAAAS